MTTRTELLEKLYETCRKASVLQDEANRISMGLAEVAQEADEIIAELRKLDGPQSS